MMATIRELVYRKPTFEHAFDNCVTPQDICRQVRRWVRVEFPHEIVRPDPATVWARGRGDSEAIAYLVKHACLTSCIDCDVWFYYPTQRITPGHALATGTLLGTRWFASDGHYGQVESQDELTMIAARIIGCKEVVARRME